MRDPDPEALTVARPRLASGLAPALLGLALVVTIEALTELGADQTSPSLALAWLQICAEHPVRIAMCGALGWWAWRPPGTLASERPPDPPAEAGGPRGPGLGSSTPPCYYGDQL